ncbi:hypothetical protein F9L16_04540 [Agarivorans sp. B2Z047]|uniref:conjugal transfer protein TraG N-terminal domain-containing protein n=1 Tax=Agarivorans sp. B2Z047 TaxID=2652721 RepID=UPI00128E0145|nr:conjugal transfer protein TraG N-terminal domain-containing protein [Agarivorans sp. B2Z047]MPW28267.1 hypothetical protein [Agarivorans sp. B2Z047]UQN43905.1 conjugal transfer protein TraG N-terminal domain-containing protein [Agarivorans sp. B2Z047]
MGDLAVFGSSYFDLMTGALGVYMYSLVWDVFKMSGLVFFAFLAVIAEALKENFESDEMNDEPHQQLGRIKVKLVVMIFILLFVATPTLTVSSLKLRVPSRQCEVLPQVNASEMVLTDEQWQYLNKYGSLMLFDRLFDEQVEQNPYQSDPAKHVAHRIFAGSLLNEYDRLMTNGYGTAIPPRYVVQQVISKALENMHAAEKLDGLGLSLQGMGRVIRVPIWWHMIRNYMLGVGAAIQAGIPCDSGIRVGNAELEGRFITSETLRSDFLDFYEKCHLPTAQKWEESKLLHKRGVIDLSNMLTSDVAVPGNDIFLNQPRLYDAIRARRLVRGFGTVEGESGNVGNDSAVGSSLPEAPAGNGYPMCDDWWVHPSFGLERQLITYFGLDTDQGRKAFQEVTRNRSTDERVLLQNLLAVKLHGENVASQTAARNIMDKMQGAYIASHEKSQESSHLGSMLFGAAVDLGIYSEYLQRAAGLKALLRAMPVATSVLIMFFMAVLPIGMVVGRFSLGPTMGLTLTYVSFYLWMPYFRLVKWIDDNFVGMLGLQWADTDRLMLDVIIGAGYIAIPVLITGVITVAG